MKIKLSDISLVLATIAFIVAIGTCVARGEEGKTPEGYEWSSDKGALKIAISSEGVVNKHMYIFKTYEPLTIAKGKIVAWNVTDKKNLTDLGKLLHARALKIDVVETVYVSYRTLMFRKSDLLEWNMPEIYKALE